VTDGALAAALVDGDPDGLARTCRIYADRLYTYCYGLLGDPDLAADALHDSLLLASQFAGRLADRHRLRPWLYALARNECLRRTGNRLRHAVPPAPTGCWIEQIASVDRNLRILRAWPRGRPSRLTSGTWPRRAW
jgi:DNA-directed RNA polymerase specialized sigma24 family protein